MLCSPSALPRYATQRSATRSVSIPYGVADDQGGRGDRSGGCHELGQEPPPQTNQSFRLLLVPRCRTPAKFPSSPAPCARATDERPRSPHVQVHERLSSLGSNQSVSDPPSHLREEKVMAGHLCSDTPIQAIQPNRDLGNRVRTRRRVDR